MARGRRPQGTNEQAVVALVRRLGAALHELGLGEIEVAWADVRVRGPRPAWTRPRRRSSRTWSPPRW
jgi:hypothetical protein